MCAHDYALCEAARCSVNMATAAECVSAGNLFVNAVTTPVFESGACPVENTLEARLDVLLERCALVKNELAVLNEERVELETNLRFKSPHALWCDRAQLLPHSQQRSN